ncbi:MAG: tetratricopeptide repeat protein [Acidobacteria bacterium]|nr:tetratricopeptide repeat protein [Acidobacteriota bacterium]
MPWGQPKTELGVIELMRLLQPVFLIFALTLGLVTAVQGAEGQPLNRDQIVSLLKGGVAPVRIATILGERGIDFEPMEEDLRALTEAKADEAVLSAVRSARQILPPQVVLARHKRRAKAFEEHGAGADAEAEYRAAIALDPKDFELQTGLARSLALQQKWDGAVAAYRLSLTQKPNDFEATYNLGLALERSGNQTEAINTWADAVKIKPDDPLPFEQLARAFTERRDWHRAATAYRGLVRLRPDSAPAHVGMGVALQNSGNVNGAVDAFRNALRVNPNDPVAHNNLGFALEEKGELAAALVEYRIATTLSPQDEGIKANLERASQKARRPTLGTMKKK